jgi:hypothetical protein
MFFFLGKTPIPDVHDHGSACACYPVFMMQATLPDCIRQVDLIVISKVFSRITFQGRRQINFHPFPLPIRVPLIKGGVNHGVRPVGNGHQMGTAAKRD